VSDDLEYEKHLLIYGYKKVNKEYQGKYMYYCRGCGGPYYVVSSEFKSGGFEEVVAEVDPDQKSLFTFNKINDEEVF